MMQAPANDRKMKRRFLVQILFSLVLCPAVGLGLHAYAGRPYEVVFPYFAIDLAIPLIGMAGVYGAMLHYGRRIATEARRNGTSEAEALRASLAIFSTLGGSLGLFALMALMSIGWRWSLPYYGLYFLYLLQLHLRWKRYQQALATAQGA